MYSLVKCSARNITNMTRCNNQRSISVNDKIVGGEGKIMFKNYSGQNTNTAFIPPPVTVHSVKADYEKKIDIFDIFDIIVKTGDIDAIEFARQILHITKEDLIKENYRLVGTVISTGNVELVTHIVDEVGVRDMDLISYAIEKNQLEIIKYFTHKFPKLFVKRDDELLKLSILSGNLDMVGYIVNFYNMNSFALFFQTHDIDVAHQTMSNPCSNLSHHLNILLYFRDIHHLSTPHFHSYILNVLKSASYNGELDIIQKLTNEFELSKTDICNSDLGGKYGHISALHSSIRMGHCNIMEYLITKYDLTIIDIISDGCDSINYAYFTNKTKIIKYFSDKMYTLSIEDLRILIIMSLRRNDDN